MNKCFYIFLSVLLAVLVCIPVRRALAEETKKVVYITFDDCPTSYTADILDILKAHNATATFFLLKVYAEERPEVVARIRAEGHAIGLHGVGHNKAHFYQTEFSPLWEMDELRVCLFQMLGEEYYLARTPFGSMPSLSRAQYKRLCENNYMLWDWNVDTCDAIGTSVSTEQIFRRAVSGIAREDTPVILMHNMRASKEALPDILHYINEMGYKTATLYAYPKEPLCFMSP